MTPQEQDKQRRIEVIRAQYPADKNIVITETDNWAGMMSSQIYAMKRRGSLPPEFTYEVKEEK
jgi:hypothetical protein